MINTWLEHYLNLKVDGTTASIEMSRSIGGWGIWETEITQSLNYFEVIGINELTININSPGGCCFTGHAIFNQFLMWKQRTGAKVTTCCYSIAASMGSVMFLLGDERKIYDNSFVMIHPPMMSFFGNHKEMLKDAKFLLNMEKVLIKTYAKRTKLTARRVIKLFAEGDTWFNAEEAVEAGLATEVIDYEGELFPTIHHGDLTNIGNMPASAAAFFISNSSSETNDIENKSEKNINAKLENNMDAKEMADQVAAHVAAKCTAEAAQATAEKALAEANEKITDLEKQIADQDGKTISAEEQKTAIAEAVATAEAAKDETITALENEVKTLKAQKEKQLNGLVQPESKTKAKTSEWDKALEACAGDYVKAREDYPEAYNAFMEASNGKN